MTLYHNQATMTQVVKIFTDALEDPKLKIAVGKFVNESKLYLIVLWLAFILFFVVTFFSVNVSIFHFLTVI